jgi:two-component system, OmpR family, phosphate regulon sensor histidine kinase PhoR
MKRALQKITVTFILIALVPVGFIIYEFSSLSDNEKIITRIYHNQLDAILYSVNQYTDDVFSSWANKIDISLLKGKSGVSGSGSHEALIGEVSQMSAVRAVYFTDLKQKAELISLSDSVMQEESISSLVKSLSPRLSKLRTYQRGGFRKIEAIDTLLSGQLIPVFFLIDEEIPEYRLAVLLIDLNLFVQNVLAPKLQAVSREEFTISAFERKTNNLIYSTEVTHPGQVPEHLQKGDPQKDVTERELWLLPGYYLSISLKDTTIKELVVQRLETSMLTFAVLFLLLVAGIVFLYANIRREILLSQSKSEFVSNVSHEIRTPLSLISMYAETLELNRVPEDRKSEYYSIIVKETARLSGIVNRILNFAQVDASKKKFEFHVVELSGLCSRIASSYETHLKERGFRFEFLAGDEKSIVNIDEESVTEAILNLLDNAVKYSKEEKWIQMRSGNDGAVAFVEVEDHGIGIAKVHQRSIFEQFYRVPTDNVHNIKGTGLGLALVKRTMQAHRGKVKVYSAPGKGSTFTLHFPLVVFQEKPAENV